jgi:hypothetical protein
VGIVDHNTSGSRVTQDVMASFDAREAKSSCLLVASREPLTEFGRRGPVALPVIQFHIAV